MYRPQDPERPQYPMFKKVNGRIVSFLSLKAALALGASVLVAVLLAVALSIPKVEAVVQTTQQERLEAQTVLTAERAAAALAPAQSELATYRAEGGSGPKTGLNDKEYQHYLELSQEVSKCNAVLSACTAYAPAQLREMASGHGITRATTDAELEEMVPLEKDELQDAVAVPLRWAVALAVIGLSLIMLCEVNGERSLALKLIDSMRFAAAQHTYEYRRTAGSHYGAKEIG